MPASKKREAQGIITKPPAKKEGGKAAKGGGGKAAKAPKAQQLPGLTKQQNTAINQRQDADIGLGNIAAGQMGQIEQNFNQPFDFGSLPQAPAAPDWSQVGNVPNAPDWSQAPQVQGTDWQSMQPMPGVPDFSGAPQGPVTGDFNAWRQQQIDSTYQDFEKRMAPQFKQAQEDFDQQMSNRGIPVGSELYNKQLKQMQDQQSDARSSAMVQAQGIAGQNASQFADVGFTARGQETGLIKDQFGMGMDTRRQGAAEGAQRFGESYSMRNQYGNEQGQQFDQANTAYNNRMGRQADQYNWGRQVRGDAMSDQMQQRNMPLNDFNSLMGSRSQYDLQNLGYSQQQQMQEDQQAQDRWMMKNTPRGGGGGGGGGAPPLWQQYGLSSPMEYDAYKSSIARAEKQFDWENNPAYRQPGGPSYAAQVGGQALGVGLGLLGQWAFS